MAFIDGISHHTTSKSNPTNLIAQLQRLSSRLSNGADYQAKRECLQLSKALTAQLEQPENVAVDMAFSPMIAVSARIAVDLNLFEYIVQHGPVASEALARLSGAGELLIVRVLRLLSSVHFVQESVGASNIWVSTPITNAMATKEIAAGHRMISQLIVPAMQSAPAFFLSNGHACPIDPHNGLVQLAFHTEKTTFEHITETSSLLKDFTLFMGNTMGARRYWVDWYPVQSRILDGAEPDKALIVDVGGGKGHDLLAFREKFPGFAARGQLVLQDLDAVLQGVDLGEVETEVEKVAYDFFTEQPVKGARVYFLHHILHDWSDEYCLRILKNIVSAMTPGYSKLLVHEMIVLEQGAPQFQAQLDIAMMAFNGGMERTRQQWRGLLEKAGLQVVEFWDPVDEGGDGIVEAVAGNLS
ncbi:o-methyltransferase [Aspergillus venezuelensis]